MPQGETLTVQQTALRMGVTLKYVRDLLYEHKLPGAQKNGRMWRIPASAVERWRQLREEQANGPTGVLR